MVDRKCETYSLGLTSQKGMWGMEDHTSPRQARNIWSCSLWDEEVNSPTRTYRLQMVAQSCESICPYQKFTSWQEAMPLGTCGLGGGHGRARMTMSQQFLRGLGSQRCRWVLTTDTYLFCNNAGLQEIEILFKGITFELVWEETNTNPEVHKVKRSLCIVPALPFTSYITSGKLFKLSELHFLLCKVRRLIIIFDPRTDVRIK